MRKGFWKSLVFMGVVALISACGGGGSGGGGTTGGSPTVSNGENSVVYAIRQASSVSSCPNGGISVDAGIDKNGNGVLDSSEVTSTQYVCNGTNGTNGANSGNGLNALVSVTTEASGANCSAGGKA